MRLKIYALMIPVCLALVLLPQIAEAGADAPLRCHSSGGSWTGKRCDYSSPPVFDLFGKIIVGTLLLMALGFGAPSSGSSVPPSSPGQ